MFRKLYVVQKGQRISNTHLFMVSAKNLIQEYTE